MNLSFLFSAHNTPAVKKFYKDKVESYPQIKTFNSESHEVNHTARGFAKKIELMREAAERGGCLVKGIIDEPIVNSNRRGKIPKDNLTQNIVFDIDGVILPDLTLPKTLDAQDIKNISEQCIALLPDIFQQTSYVVHASSSMGRKKNKISLHLDFWLDEPIEPVALKEFLEWVNFQIPIFEQQFSLTASGTALHYPVDKCLADNSRLIYIGTPEFNDGIQDPIPNTADRIFGVKKANYQVALAKYIKTKRITKKKNKTLVSKKLRHLRDIQGLPKRREKGQIVNFDNSDVYVVTNPAKLKMTPYEDRGEYVTYNVNDGDSGAYYVKKLDPQIVFNFKNEPNFLFASADPDQYREHIETYVLPNSREGATAEDVKLPLVFRDEKTDCYYAGIYNSSTGYIDRINKASRGALEDYVVQHGGIAVEEVETWNYEFHPNDDRSVDFKNRFINKYVPSELMRVNPEVPKGYITPLDYKTSQKLEEFCPFIYNLIFHAVGEGEQEYLHFINWLAAALNEKIKMQTAWIFHGVQGTGKGQLFERIIAPLVGEGVDSNYPYAIKLRQDNVEEQFNQWEETTLFAALDEFRLNNSPQAQKLFNKIKNMITDTENTVRGMRENTRRVKLYTNYLIFSNAKDMIEIPEDDRRFNVAVRQDKKLSEVFENLEEALNFHIPNELPVFARAMREFDYDLGQARACLENHAKRQVREASKTSVDEFIDALKVGDLDYFLPILDMPQVLSNNEYSTPAKMILRRAIEDWEDDNKVVQRLTLDQIRVLYNCVVGRVDNVNKFGKLLAKCGINIKKLRIGNISKRGLEIFWTLNTNTIEDVRTAYPAIQETTNNVFPLNKELP